MFGDRFHQGSTHATAGSNYDQPHVGHDSPSGNHPPLYRGQHVLKSALRSPPLRRSGPRLRPVVTANDDEIDLTAGLEILDGVLVLGRTVASDCGIVAWKLDHHVVLASLADHGMERPPADEEFAAEEAERDRIPFAVFLVCNFVENVESCNPIAFDHASPHVALEISSTMPSAARRGSDAS